jgi:hypothetical protein
MQGGITYTQFAIGVHPISRSVCRMGRGTRDCVRIIVGFYQVRFHNYVYTNATNHRNTATGGALALARHGGTSR